MGNYYYNYINEFYLKNAIQEKIKAEFKKKNDDNNNNIHSVQLQKIMTHQAYTTFLSLLKKANYKQDLNIITHLYNTAEIPKQILSFLNSKEFLSLIQSITNKKIRKVEGKILQLKWKCYSILNDKNKEHPGIDIILDFTDSWPQKANGEIIYTDTKNTSITIPSSPNTLTIIKRNKNVKKFIHYINNKAGTNKRYVLLATLV